MSKKNNKEYEKIYSTKENLFTTVRIFISLIIFKAILDLPVNSIIRQLFGDIKYELRIPLIIFSKVSVAFLAFLLFKLCYYIMLKLQNKKLKDFFNTAKDKKMTNKEKKIIATILCAHIILIFLLQLVLLKTGVIEINSIAIADSDELIFIIIYSILLMPVIEELVFRKYLITDLRKYGIISAVVISSVIFSAGHINPANVIMSLVPGLIFGYIFYKTDNVKNIVLLHQLFNLIGILVIPLILTYMM